MSTSMVLFEKMGLAKSNLTYSEYANAFLTSGYTSMVGNTYYNSIRIAEGILIKEDVGDAHYGITFLNGIKIYTIKTKTLIASKCYNGLKYSKQTVRSESFELLFETLKEAHRNSNTYFNEFEVKRHINMVLNQAFDEDQRKVLMENTQRFLIGR